MLDPHRWIQAGLLHTVFTKDFISTACLFLCPEREHSFTDCPSHTRCSSHTAPGPVWHQAQSFPPHGTRVCWLFEAKSDYTGVLCPGCVPTCLPKGMCTCVYGASDHLFSSGILLCVPSRCQNPIASFKAVSLICIIICDYL